MTPVDGIAAMNTMLSFQTWRPGHCLEAVWQAYARNGAQSDQTIPTAYDAWLVSPEADRRGGDYASIPAGVPVYFGPKSSSNAGDIVISAGDGWCVATDIPGHSGVIGKMTLQDRQNEIGRPYLGWTTSILSWPILQGQENEMTPEQDQMLRNIFAAIFNGGTSMPDGGRSIGQSLADLAAGQRPAVMRADPSNPDATIAVPWIQELADTKTLQLQTNEMLSTATGDIDYDALARAMQAQGVSVILVQPTDGN